MVARIPLIAITETISATPSNSFCASAPRCTVTLCINTASTSLEWENEVVEKAGRWTRHAASQDQRNESGESAGRNHGQEREQRVITSKSAARVAGYGSRKTVPAGVGSKSKHEHASRRTAYFLERRGAHLASCADQRLSRSDKGTAGNVLCCYLCERLPLGCR